MLQLCFPICTFWAAWYMFSFLFVFFISVLWFPCECLSHTTLCTRVCECVCACARVCMCSVLIQGSGWSWCPRGRYLAMPTQFFHIRHCNCSHWPGCLRLGTHTHTRYHTLVHTHSYVHAQAHAWPRNCQQHICDNQPMVWCAVAIPPSLQPMVCFVTACLPVITSDCFLTTQGVRCPPVTKI